MKTPRDDFNIADELRALRPSPTPAFAVELDSRMAAGFPPKSSPGSSAWRRLTARLRAASPRRILLPAGAVALTALIVATAVIAIGESGGTTSSPRQVADAAGRGNERQAESSGHVKASPQSADGAGETAASSGGSAGYQYSAAPPPIRHRDVERDAELVLRSQPGEIEADAKQVFAAVHAARGIVLNSSIHDWAAGQGNARAGEASASFELLVPAAHLSDTLASLSRIADVRSRHESTLDITAPTVSVRDRLMDSEATIEGLLAQLAGAESDSERSILETQLRRERRHATTLRSQLDRLNQRADFAHVSLQIESGETAGGASSGWGPGDALGDAGHILAIAAGVAVIGLAVVGPLALIALVAWLVHRAWVRHRRQHTLD